MRDKKNNFGTRGPAATTRFSLRATAPTLSGGSVVK